MKKKDSIEYKRGYKNMKEAVKKYRSFFKKDGIVYGYTKRGSKQIVARTEDLNYRKGCDGGVSKALKEAIKERPTKTRIQNRKANNNYISGMTKKIM